MFPDVGLRPVLSDAPPEVDSGVSAAVDSLGIGAISATSLVRGLCFSDPPERVTAVDFETGEVVSARRVARTENVKRHGSGGLVTGGFELSESALLALRHRVARHYEFKALFESVGIEVWSGVAAGGRCRPGSVQSSRSRQRLVQRVMSFERAFDSHRSFMSVLTIGRELMSDDQFVEVRKRLKDRIMSRAFPGSLHVWVKEYQRRGAHHLNLLSAFRSDVSEMEWSLWLSEAWIDLCGLRGSTRPDLERNSVVVKPLIEVGGAAGYVAYKEFAKKDQKAAPDGHHSAWWNVWGGRSDYWKSFQRVPSDSWYSSVVHGVPKEVFDARLFCLNNLLRSSKRKAVWSESVSDWLTFESTFHCGDGAGFLLALDDLEEDFYWSRLVDRFVGGEVEYEEV